MNERLKMIRESMGMNQSKFAKLLGIGQSTLAMMEVGKRDILERHIKTICSICGINEEWLRTGTGEMKIHDEDSDILEIAKEFSLDRLGQAILKGYMHLGEYEKAVIGKYIKSVAAEYEKGEENESVQTFRIPARGGIKEVPLTKEQRDELGQLKKELEVKDDSDKLV